MSKITKKLHFRKGGVTNDISLYNAASDVGASYITLKVDSTLVYAPISIAGDVGSTGLHVRRSSKPLTNVTWKSLNNVTNPSGSNLLKTTATGWNSYAVSNETIASGKYGYVAATNNGSAGTAGQIGLMLNTRTPTTTNSYQFADYSILLNAGPIQIFELGVLKYTVPGAYANGDKIAVSIENNVVNYYFNNAKVYTSSTAPSGTYNYYGVIYTQNSGMNNVQYGSDFVFLSSVQDPTILASGSVASTGGGISANPVPTGGTFTCSGQNVLPTYSVNLTWTATTDANVYNQFTINFNPHTSLAEVHHYRLLSGTSAGAVTTDNGTVIASARQILTYGGVGPYYWIVRAEDSSNNVLFSSAVYGPTTGTYSNRTQLGEQDHVDITAADGVTGRARFWDGGPTGQYSSLSHGDVSRRWFYVIQTYSNGYAGAPNNGAAWSAISCADSCVCNCNYCTCNCNYCTCNCNYCTCNCNYAPCSCSSGN